MQKEAVTAKTAGAPQDWKHLVKAPALPAVAMAQIGLCLAASVTTGVNAEKAFFGRSGNIAGQEDSDADSKRPAWLTARMNLINSAASKASVISSLTSAIVDFLENQTNNSGDVNSQLEKEDVDLFKESGSSANVKRPANSDHEGAARKKTKQVCVNHLEYSEAY